MSAINGENLNFGSVNGIVVGQDTADPTQRTYWPVSSTWDAAINELRVKASLTGGGSPDLAAILSAIVNRGIDTADQVRANRSLLEALLHELQHPKQELFRNTTDVALAAGIATWVTPVIDARLFRMIGWYVWNTGGANNITAEYCVWAEDAAPLAAGPPAGAGFQSANGAALAIVPNGSAFTQNGTIAAGDWSPNRFSPLSARYLRFYLTSAAGTTARICVVGMR